MEEILINERYRIGYKLGQGGFGIVYSGIDIHTDEEVAIKLESLDLDCFTTVDDESEAYHELAGSVGVPRVRWLGEEGDYRVMVLDSLGPSLDDLVKFCGGKFSLKTILLIADQALSRLEQVHSRGYVHRDVKPDNFLMGTGKEGNHIYIIDFGISEHIDNYEDEEYPSHDGCLGTFEYASISSHYGNQLSFKDDLESLGYSLLSLQGLLPWQDLRGASDDEDLEEKIMDLKVATSVETLCRGLPHEFAKYIIYARSLDFEDKPDYAYLRRLFRNRFLAQGFQYDFAYDWTEKIFNQLRENDGEE